MNGSAQSPVVIAGAGLLGSLLAWRLARQGIAVTVHEQAEAAQPQAAAWTAAGMIAPWAERALCHPQVFQLGLQSLPLWPQLLAELQQDSGAAVAYGRGGSLLVAHPADQSELLQFGQSLRHSGLWPGGVTDTVQPVQGAQIVALEPALNRSFHSGYWLPQETHIDNRTLLPALQRAAQQAGARFFFASALTQMPASERWIDCRGLGAAADLPALRAVRGEVLWLESRDVRISRAVRLLHPRYHLYLVPKGEVDGHYRYILGATEIESADRSPVSVRSALELLSAVYSLCPALAEARILSFDVNCRPALPDHCPQILPVGTQGLRINGLFRHGYLLAPAVLLALQERHGLALGLKRQAGPAMPRMTGEETCRF